MKGKLKFFAGVLVIALALVVVNGCGSSGGNLTIEGSGSSE